MIRSGWLGTLACVMFIAALGAAGCGGAKSTPGQVDIETLRDRAEDHPKDAATVSAWALAELFMEEGDPAKAKTALARAAKLAPTDAAVRFAQAFEADLHGDADAALLGELETLALVAANPAPQSQAIATVALSHMERLVEAAPTAEPKVLEGLDALRSKSEALGAPANHLLHTILIGKAYEKGDLPRIKALTAEAGCLASWRVAGPFGPRVLLGFDEPYAPEKDGLAAKSYALGAGRDDGVVSTRTTRGCALHVGSAVSGQGGTFYAASQVDVADAGDYQFRLETPNAAALFIDGRPVARFDSRAEPTSRTNYVTLPLTAGTHAVLVKITSRHPNPVLVLAATKVVGTPFDPAASVTDPFHGWLGGAVALATGNPVVARERLTPFVQSKKAATPLLILASETAFLDPVYGDDERRDEARRYLTTAVARDANAWYPAMTHARLEAAEGRVIPAVASLEAAEKRWPKRLELPLALADLYQERQWASLAAQAVDRAYALAPQQCQTISAMRALALTRRQYEKVRQWSEATVACNAENRSVLDVFLRERKWDAAAAEVARLSSLAPQESATAGLPEQIAVARSRGDDKAIEKLLVTYLSEAPEQSDRVLTMADWQLSQGRRTQAEALLADAVRKSPESSVSLLRVSDALFHDHPMAKYRLDGTKVIKDFEKSGHKYDQPKIMVLDYTVMRVFDDGSFLELTHNISRAQSDEGVNALGEYSVPEGAELFTLRTRKADGRIIEPDLIEGKDTLSLPELKPGDYVESEYLRANPPNVAFPGGFQTWRFYFSSLEEAFDRSEFTVVVPTKFEPQVDPRGPAPKTDSKMENGTRVLHWIARESRPIVPEAMSVPGKEYIPSIQVSARATWQDLVDTMRDALADANTADPAALRIVREVLGDARDKEPLVQARRLYTWVLENVEQDNNVFGPASVMLHTKTGNRARVLHYFLGLAGVPSSLVIAKTLASDQETRDVADSSEYSQLLVRVGTGPSAVVLSVADRSAPFGFLPPLMRGQQAMTIATPTESFRLDAVGAVPDQRIIDVDVQLAENGSAKLSVVETQQGAPAIEWRNDLDQIPAAQIQSRFAEGYVARLIQGAELDSLKIEGRDSRDAQLRMRYEMHVDSLGRKQGDIWLVPGIFPTMLAPTYASLGAVKYPKLVPLAQDLVVRVRIHAPKGMHAEAPPAAVSLTGFGGASFSVTATKTADGVAYERRVKLPLMRIPVSEYEAFARFCRDADEAEARELAIER